MYDIGALGRREESFSLACPLLQFRSPQGCPTDRCELDFLSAAPEVREAPLYLPAVSWA